MLPVLLDSDFADVPVETQAFARTLCDFGLSRIQVHGFFVLFGLDIGTPRAESELKDLTNNAQIVVPHDRSINLEERVGDFYDGYESILNEFYLRSGVTLNIREVRFGDSANPVSILYPRDQGLLDSSVSSINKLSDSSRLMWSLLEALGQSTALQERSLLDAFLCGVFQMQLHAIFDVSGAQQLNSILTSYPPLVLGEMFKSLTLGSCNRLHGYLPLQVPVQNLMAGMSEEYARQMWGFQSHIFFKDQQPIAGVDDLSLSNWFSWVLDRAIDVDNAFPDGLVPFSQSGVALSPIPTWRGTVEDPIVVSRFIYKIWGLDAADLRNKIEIMEYKACLIHVVYSSLTQSRETVH